MPGPIRILIMLDNGATFGPGDATTNPNDAFFTLSEVVRTLQDATEPLEFTVTKAHRGVDPLFPPGATVSPALQRFVADYSNFRFDQHDLNNTYDEIWFFGIAVGDANGQGSPSTLSQAEIDAVFAFMENGGGVFATGDHWDMGAPLCGGIPRVRSMRSWFYGDAAHRQNRPNYNNLGVDLGPGKNFSAPSALGPYRHDTLQPEMANMFPFDAQSDATPQPLQLAYQRGGNLIQWKMPHPLFCSAEGDIDTFPDHMHEGQVVVPLARDWANTITYPGGTVPEYPSAMMGTTVTGAPVVQPKIVAWGNVIPGHLTISTEPLAHVGDPNFDTVAATFGIVCVYDGFAENKGRVVTDSTFHHYFDINLTGDPVATGDKQYGFLQPLMGGGYADGPQMRKMRAFFRNIAVWIARPQAQADLMARAAALVAGGHPFNEIAPAEAAYSDEAVMALGAQAIVALRRLSTLCQTITGITIWLYLVEWELPWPPPPPCPWWSRNGEGDPYENVVAPVEVVQALLGGAVAELRGAGAHALRDRKNPKVFDTLKGHIEKGFRRGAIALSNRLETRSKAFAAASHNVRGGYAWTKQAHAKLRAGTEVPAQR